jgi:adenylate kinase family enzyme
MKIYIGGGPGAGKSTFSRRLAGKLDVPLHELDRLLNSGIDGGEPFEAASTKVLAEITAKDTWIAEGSYLGWLEPLLIEADLIVYLDVPWRIASYRILSRHVKLTVARNNPYPGWRGQYQFWRWSRRYYKSSNPPRLNSWAVPDNRAIAVELLDAYKFKMVTCRNKEDVEQVLAQHFV